MAQNFEAKPIRRMDQNGVLTGVGVEWTEEASLRHNNRLLMWFAFLICLPSTLVSLGLAVAFGLPGLISFGLFAWMTGYVLYWQFGPLPKRSIICARDGSIITPHGVPGQNGRAKLRLAQADIASIEIGPCRSGMRQDWTSTVQIVSEDGMTETISQKLHREEGREVAVKLNHALREMRRAVATPVTAAAPVRVEMARERVFD
jgi:hypothetical protein